MKWTPGLIERKVVWDEGLFTLAIRAPEVLPFSPGQFLQIGVEGEDQHFHRPYSVASPHGPVLEFFIVLVENGSLTPKLWRMESGDPIDVSQRAAGSFTLDHCPTAHTLWMMATGTGLAPYIAMLRTEQPWRQYERIVLVHGSRYGRDLAYQPEFQEMSQQHGEAFRYVPVVSRETVAGALSGRITTCIENGSLESAVDSRFSTDCCVMLCGNPDMLDQTEEILGGRGLKRHKAKDPGHIVVERYW